MRYCPEWPLFCEHTNAVMSAHSVEKDDGVFHLPGHPLPAFVSLVSTDAAEPSVDLFLVSLSRPVLLCAFSFPSKKAGDAVEVDCAPSQPSTQQLCSFKEHLAVLRQREPDLLVYGLSMYPPACQSKVHATLGLPFPLLSDTRGELAEKLALPRADECGVPLLRRCTMLIREGQIQRLDFPLLQPAQAAVRAEYMLQRDAGEA